MQQCKLRGFDVIAVMLVAVAGLFKYLADEYPPDLPKCHPV